MDKSLRAPSQEVRPHVPEEWVSADSGGLALLWIDAILFVPAIFGVMFLPTLLRTAALSLMIGLVVTYAILYSWAKLHPASTGAHLLHFLHLSPPQRVPR